MLFVHISIYPPHRKFLRFTYQGTCNEFTLLPFGLSLSPKTFCLCAEVGLAPPRISGLRILTYIDDWLFIAESKEKVLQDTCYVLAHITSLGFRVNMNKSIKDRFRCLLSFPVLRCVKTLSLLTFRQIFTQIN